MDKLFILTVAFALVFGTNALEFKDCGKKILHKCYGRSLLFWFGFWQFFDLK